MTAPPLDRDKLAKLCGLFSSSHDGERANAAAAADKLVRQAGLRWPDVLLPRLPATAIDDARDAAAYCRRFPELLTPWETGFLQSVAEQRRPPSEKQRAVIARIFTKCRERAAA